MGQSSISTLANSFHTYFTRNRQEKIGFEDQPLLKWMPKLPWKGTTYTFSVNYDVMQGSHTFSTAQSNMGPSADAKYEIPRSRFYVPITLDTESMEISEQDDDSSWIDLRKDETERAFSASTQVLAHRLLRNSGAAIGQCNGISGSTVTLTNATDTAFFHKGQKLRSATTDGTSGSLNGGPAAVVSAVSTSAGTVTATFSNISGFVGTAAGDYLFGDGDFGAGLYGLDAYVPATAPTAGDSFSNSALDRSAQPTRLAGHRYDGSGMSIEEAFLKGLAQFRQEGGTGMFDAVFCNYERFVETGLALGSKATRDEAASAAMGYDVIKVHGGGKPIFLMADHNVQPDTAWCLTKKGNEPLGLRTIGPVPRFLQKSGGSELIVEPTSDGYQIRTGWRCNLVCIPGNQGRIKLPTGG